MEFSNRVRPIFLFALSVVVILVTSIPGITKPSRIPSTPPPRSASTTVTLNLADFGAVGDGVTDNGPAFQSAIDALAAAGGGTLLVPAGKFLIATPVVKDFSALDNATITIQGVPSTTMPAPTSATGQELSAGLDLTSEIIPATGSSQITFAFSHVSHLLLEHLGFTGRADQITDALITVNLDDIDDAKIRHCEFYGLSTFGLSQLYGAGNIVRATNSELSIELSVFLGCTANSGGYASVVENFFWRKFSISNSIFLDYGQRAFFSKTGLGAPISWIDIGNAAAATPESPRREFIVRETFLDEGGWVGISGFPYRWGPYQPIDLVYITGLKMNVSNFATAGHMLYDLENLFVEKSDYGWSHHAQGALDIHRTDNVILDKLTCVAGASRLLADDRVGRLTVINSQYSELVSDPQTTTVLNTSPEQDPVQYVRQQFMSSLNREPDPTAHFYWSNILLNCGQDNGCADEKRSALSEYLSRSPQPNFSLNGTVEDEDGNPINGMTVTLSGSQSVATVTDSNGKFHFLNLPTSGVYNVVGNLGHYGFAKTITLPATDLSVTYTAVVDRHSISGRVTGATGTPISGVSLHLAQSSGTVATSDEDGVYSFSGLAGGQDYTVVPSSPDFVFTPANRSFQDLSADQTGDFVGQPSHISIEGKITDEDGDPLDDVDVSLAGSQSETGVTDSAGNFHFSNLPTSGTYSLNFSKRHYHFSNNGQTFTLPTDNIVVAVSAALNRHSINGRITRINGAGVSGANVQLAQSAILVTTDANGFYSLQNLPAGENYTVVATLSGFEIASPNSTVNDLSADVTTNFVAKLKPELMTVENTEFAVALDSFTFLTQPFPIFSPYALGTDRLTRVMVFIRNFEDLSGPSQIALEAEDSEGNTYPLEIEQISDVEGQPSLKQLNIKLSPTLPGDNCLKLNLSIAGVKSNVSRICISSNEP